MTCSGGRRRGAPSGRSDQWAVPRVRSRFEKRSKEDIMKTRNLIVIFGVCIALILVQAPVSHCIRSCASKGVPASGLTVVFGKWMNRRRWRI